MHYTRTLLTARQSVVQLSHHQVVANPQPNQTNQVVDEWCIALVSDHAWGPTVK